MKDINEMSMTPRRENELAKQARSTNLSGPNGVKKFLNTLGRMGTERSSPFRHGVGGKKLGIDKIKEEKMTIKEHYKTILKEMASMNSSGGSVPTTPAKKKLASLYGDKNKITRGDVIAGRISSNKPTTK